MEPKYTVHPDYDGLPDPIKSVYSPEEYAWLTDEQRENVIDDEVYPEPNDDLV